jgi:hypothetical protein
MLNSNIFINTHDDIIIYNIGKIVRFPINEKLVEVIKTKISSIKTSNKFKPNQFCINHIKKR